MFHKGVDFGCVESESERREGLVAVPFLKSWTLVRWGSGYRSGFSGIA